MNFLHKSLLAGALISSGLLAFAQDESGKDLKIADFTSVAPTGQTQTIVIPSSHAWQMIAKSRETQYSDGSGTLGTNNDFTGYVPIKGSKEGYLSINHETSPGGVSLLNLTLDKPAKKWVVGEVRAVDFSGVQSTVRNCSGGITPWGTVITSEENLTSRDANGDGYQDIGWQVEIDPVTGKIMDYNGDGIPDKLWGHGRLNHENIAISASGNVTYQTEDGGSSGVFKFVAQTPGNLSKGTLFVLRRDSSNSTTGSWIAVPNDKNTLNNLRTIAPSLGGTNWSSAEDIEFGPDGKMYFTSKGTGTIWRFKDNGSTVSEIEAWVTNQQYMVEYEGGSQLESWGTGIDNLAFDKEGNLWAQQDGGRDNIWVIYPDHTPANPNLKLFMTTPSGSESTGLTFTPDGKYGFLSIQTPSSGNTEVLTDAAGNEVVFNRDVTLVFARKEHLGKKNAGKKNKIIPSKMMDIYPNPFEISTEIKITMPQDGEVLLEVRDIMGSLIASLHNGVLTEGAHVFNFDPTVPGINGIFLVHLVVDNQNSTVRIVKQK